MNKWIVGILFVAMPCVAWSAAQTGKNETDAKYIQFFKGLDANQDGKISKEEAELKAPAMARNFGAIDANHDGGLTIAEMKAYSAAIEKKRIEFERYLNKADKDKNGMLSRDEANAAPKSHAIIDFGTNFDVIDSNRDGQLVMKEISDYMRAITDAAAATRAHQPGSTAPPSPDPLQ